MSKEIALQQLWSDMTCETGTDFRRAVFEAMRRKKNGEWDRRVYLPIENFLDVVIENAMKKTGIISRWMIEKKIMQAGLYPLVLQYSIVMWSITKKVYSFEKELFDELKDTECEGILQRDLLLHMPEPCIALHVPGLYDEGYEYVVFTYSTNKKDGNIRLYMLLQDGETLTLNKDDYDSRFLYIDLDKDELPIDHLWQIGREIQDGDKKEYHVLFPDRDTEPSEEEMKDHLSQKINQYVRKVLPFLLYLCTYQPDVECITPDKYIKRNPDIVRRYIAGKAVSKVLRESKKRYLGESQPTGSHKRPHYRNAYYRRQLYGHRPKEGEPDTREHKLIWLPPTYVNMRDFFPEESNVQRIKHCK